MPACRRARWTTRRSSSHLDSRLARPFLVGFSDSIDLVFLLRRRSCWWSPWSSSSSCPEERLRQVSGIEARRQEADDTAAIAAEAAGVSGASSQMVDGETIEEDDDRVTAPPRT